MTDNIDDLAKRALGEPPEDPEARARALATLRAQITAAGASSASKGHQIRAVVALGVAVATIVLLVAIVPSSTPAAALEALGVKAASYPPVVVERGQTLESHSEMFTEQRNVDVQTEATYLLDIRSSIDTATKADGSSVRTETIRSIEFPAPEDEATWEAQGAPALPQPGDVTTDHFSTKEGWYNPDAISEDPVETLAALRSGQVSDQGPGDDQVFLLMGELLAEPTLTTGQRSALFGAAGMLEGVQAIGDHSDPLGRRGEAFALEQDGHKTILTFDPANGTPLAAEYLYVGSGAADVLNWIAFEGTQIDPAT